MVGVRLTRGAALAQLADLVGCQVEELPALLDRMPHANAVRRRVLELRLHDGLTYGAIGAVLCCSGSRAQQHLRGAVEELVLVHAGFGDFSARLRRVLGIGPGLKSFASVVGSASCHDLLRQQHCGHGTIRELHQHAQRQGLVLACGCPDLACSVCRQRGLGCAPLPFGRPTPGRRRYRSAGDPMSTRLRNTLERNLGASALDGRVLSLGCAMLVTFWHSRRPAIQELHDLLREADLALACGCPVTRCRVCARQRLGCLVAAPSEERRRLVLDK